VNEINWYIIFGEGAIVADQGSAVHITGAVMLLAAHHLRQRIINDRNFGRIGFRIQE
jgi:hypothetical protein